MTYRVLHVIPKGMGGSSISAENIAYKEKKIYCNISGIFGLVRALVCAFRVSFTKADIVNFHNPQPAYFYSILPHSKKTVFTSHGHWIGYFQAFPSKKKIERMKASLLIHIQTSAINRANVVVAVSHRVKDVIMKSSKPKVITVIHNGVDVKEFMPSKKKRQNIALWVGSNPELKGLEEAIKIAYHKKMKLLVVSADGISNKNVEYLGNVDRKDMADIYRKTSLLIYPSKWDGHPLVPLEAMASGCDVLASEASNLEIAPLRYGWYKISGKKGRKIAEKNTWKRVRKKYTEIYEKLIA